jgi:C4-dicarboxylate-specific signal transduction histidine kinase
MGYANITGLTSGVLQFAVAIYALRLTRLYGTARIGWSAFSTFALLTMLHLVLALGRLRGQTDFGFEPDLLFSSVSVLLLVSLAHLDSLLRERARAEKLVKDQTAELTRANEELRQAAATLEAEIAERKQMQEQMEKTHKELLVVSRQAGMSEVATGVLHNVGNVLNSVNVSAGLVEDRLRQFKIENIARVAALMREHAEDLGQFMTQDRRGKQVPAYLEHLAQHLSAEHALLMEQISFVKNRVDHIKEIVATQQNYGRVTGLTEKVKITELVEDVLRMHSTEMSEQAVRVERDYAPTLPEVIVDRHKVLQILLNLLTNAKHACVDSGSDDKRVTVQVTNGDDRVRVMLSDNGVGIPEANLTKIFNHGFTTRKKGGHGFGLHSGALAAKEMGGALKAYSDGPGKGATFTLELPVQPRIR